MVEPVPRWIMQRYASLWNRFKNKPFTREEAVKILKDKEQVVSVFLSDLKKAGWIEVELSPKDTRIRFYKLKEPNEAVLEIVRSRKSI